MGRAAHDATKVESGAELTMKRILLILISALIIPGCTERDYLVVGSKNFTEQIILAKLLAQQIERRTGIEVERKSNLGGTLVCHRALEAGQIDLYPEYTGTAFAAILREEIISDPKKVYERVKAEYARQFRVHVAVPFGFENTYAILIRKQEAERLGIQRLSEAGPHSSAWRAGMGHEFLERADGYPGLVETYGLKFSGEPLAMDLNMTYRAIADEKVDLIVGNSTDAQIEAMNLFPLADDRRYFPPYEAVPVVREAALKKYPKLRGALEELGGKINTEQMRRMNYLVDIEKKSPREVAREFLEGLETEN